MLASTVAVQCSFMLPVATPPNAVAYSTGRLKVSDMVSNVCLLVHLSAPDTGVQRTEFFGPACFIVHEPDHFFGYQMGALTPVMFNVKIIPYTAGYFRPFLHNKPAFHNLSIIYFTMFSPPPSINCMPIMEGRFIM